MIVYGAIKAAAPVSGRPTGYDLLRNPRPPQQRHRFHRGGAPRLPSRRLAAARRHHDGAASGAPARRNRRPSGRSAGYIFDQGLARVPRPDDVGALVRGRAYRPLYAE